MGEQTATADMADVIAAVPSNTREVVRLRRTEHNGVDLLDARVWTVPVVPGGEATPTKKDLCLRRAPRQVAVQLPLSFAGL